MFRAPETSDGVGGFCRSSVPFGGREGGREGWRCALFVSSSRIASRGDGYITVSSAANLYSILGMLRWWFFL